MEGVLVVPAESLPEGGRVDGQALLLDLELRVPLVEVLLRDELVPESGERV